MLRCALCKKLIDPESPYLSGGFYALNPATWRMAWMCGHCLIDAIDLLKGVPAKDSSFEDRHDEYLQAIA